MLTKNITSLAPSKSQLDFKLVMKVKLHSSNLSVHTLHYANAKSLNELPVLQNHNKQSRTDRNDVSAYRNLGTG